MIQWMRHLVQYPKWTNLDNGTDNWLPLIDVVNHNKQTGGRMKYVRFLSLMALAIMSITIFAFFNGTGQKVSADNPASIVMDMESIALSVLAAVTSTAEIATDCARITNNIPATHNRTVLHTAILIGGADIICCTLTG